MKKIGMMVVFLILAYALRSDSYSGQRTIEMIITDISKKIDLTNLTVCDVGSDKGDVMIWFSQYAKAVKGIEQNSVTSANSRKRRDKQGKFLDVITGDATSLVQVDPNTVRSLLPVADVYYIWMNIWVTSEMIELIETQDIKGIFIFGNHSMYIMQEFFKARGMVCHTVETWQGTFRYYIWDKTKK